MGDSKLLQSRNISNMGASGSQMDFVLKIISVPGHGKVRVQLWENAGNSGSANHRHSRHLAPLFLRNAVGCIVVGRSDQPETLEK